MDKRVILAVAGSGKTKVIIDDLNLDTRALIITYTINNAENLRLRVIKKFGYFPDNIKIIKYVTFLYSFCYKPIISNVFKSKGISFTKPPEFTRMLKDARFFRDSRGRLYSNRVAKLLEALKALDKVNERIKKYFDVLYIDEVQDFGGHDFNLLKSIMKTDIKILLVGDFFQHTYDTSNDGRTNLGLYKDLRKYQIALHQMGLSIDRTTLISSYRCCPNVCAFISESLGINMLSTNSNHFNVALVEDPADAEKIFFNRDIVKLFYMNSSKYNCYSQNWGQSKGQDHYVDVCVVLNDKSLQHFKNNDLINLSPQTRNKLYVACSRAKGNLYFVAEEHYKQYRMK